MKVKYFGTAAYEGVPALFCNCRVCRLARERGGRNLRRRAQTLINGELLMDFNADTVCNYLQYGFDWNAICACLITHSHCDHLYPEDVEIAWLGAYSHDHAPVQFYAPQGGCERLKPFVERTRGGACVTPVRAGERFTVGNGKYSVLPLRANHDGNSDPVIYSISCEGQRLLYAHDTGVFLDEAWEGLKREGRYDFLSLDCTGCLGRQGEWRNGHMSLQTNLEVIERMKEEKLVDEQTRIVLNHFSHNGGQIYDEMLEEAQKHGVIVSYDGMEVVF